MHKLGWVFYLHRRFKPPVSSSTIDCFRNLDRVSVTSTIQNGLPPVPTNKKSVQSPNLWDEDADMFQIFRGCFFAPYGTNSFLERLHHCSDSKTAAIKTEGVYPTVFSKLYLNLTVKNMNLVIIKWVQSISHD